MTALADLAEWASAVTLDEVPARVVELAKSQILSQLAAIRAGASHPDGQRLLDAYGPVLDPDPRRTAFILAGLGSWLHFDDTAYAGHLGNSTVAVPLACGYAFADGISGRDLLTAVIVANECAARITAATTLGPFRGQMAAHTHILGAAAAWLRCTGAKAPTWVDAFGLALAMPPWSLSHAFFASDARLLSSATPVRLGLDACAGAEAGLHGAPDLLEHPRGFLDSFADVPVLPTVTHGLGRRWHTDTLSFKVHPSGPGTDAAVDCAKALHRRYGPFEADQVAEVVVHTSLYTLLVHRTAAAYVTGPTSPVSALVSTTPYPVATALLTGQLKPSDFTAPALLDQRRWDLAAKVRLTHDEAMTARLLAAEAPFGEALRLAGDDAYAWLHAFGGDALVAAAAFNSPRGSRRGRPLARAAKATPARVEVRLTDGRSVHRGLAIPIGAAGSATRTRHRELVHAKFVSVGGPARTADAVAGLDRFSPARLRRFIATALRPRPARF